MKKDIIRKEMINKRKNILNKKKISTIIVDKIINLDIYKKSQVIALYNSMPSEVDTKELIKVSLNNKKVLLPKIVNNKMIFIEVSESTRYKKSRIGVLEPDGIESKEKPDLIIVPGVSFDKKCHRLGFGMGYYDKYLENNDIYKIGICFSEQIVDSLPISELDVPMNLVIKEKEFY